MQQSSYRLFLRDTMASPSSAVFARFTGLIEFCVDKSPATNEVREFMKDDSVSLRQSDMDLAFWKLDLKNLQERTICDSLLATEEHLESIGIAKNTVSSFCTMMKNLVTALGKKESLSPDRNVLPLEWSVGIMLLFSEVKTPYPTSHYDDFKLSEPGLAPLLDILENCKHLTAGILEFVLKMFEDHPEKFSGLRTIFALTKLIKCDKERSQESRILKLFWICADAHGLNGTIEFCLSKIAEHYTSDPEVGRQEDFMQMNEDQMAPFLHACLSADLNTCFPNSDVDSALKQTKLFDEKALFWLEMESKCFDTIASSKWVSALSFNCPITVRCKIAKDSLARLNLLKSMSSDLNPHQSDTLTSIMSSVMSSELETLNILKKETELHGEVVLQVEKLSEKHLQAYEAMKKQQYERIEKFFQTCQKEKEDVFKEALYKKARYLARIGKASICTDIKSYAEDVLKRIVQQTGSVFKETEGREKVVNTECALCCLEFSKKRKRACLSPCGHTCACLPCAIKAWEHKPSCPWCKAVIEKPIPLPPKLFF